MTSNVEHWKVPKKESLIGIDVLQKRKEALYLQRFQKQGYPIGLVVQLVRMPACHAGGREFESRPDRLKEKRGNMFWSGSSVG